MTAIEIILIIIGFICLCVSCFVAKKNSSYAEGEKESLSSELWTEREEEKIKERVGEILSERQDELVDTTEERMNRLCNDKIMAVDEFSQQILEKIDANHQEVVFMYNMLSEKEKELKEFMSKPVKKESMAETRMASEPAVSNRMDLNPVTASQTAISRLTANAQEAEKKKTVKKAEPKKAVKNETSKPEMPVAGQGNVNEKIKELHKQGKSVLEISKQLNIGQGEVKLVLALYGGDNK